MEEQLNITKSENKRKEEIIKQLTNIEVQPRYASNKFDCSKIDSVLGSDRVALEQARKELHSTQIKMEQLNQQV